MGIFKDGDQFTIYGERRPYKLRTSFCLLHYYLTDQRDKGRRWLDRIQDIGFDGPRLFGENQMWFDTPKNPFYGSGFTPMVKAVNDFNMAPSQFSFAPGYREAMRALGHDLEARRMIAEVSCIATLKELEQAVTSHMLNKFAQLFNDLYPDPTNTPFLHETVNEFDGGGSQLRDLTEVERYGSRWRRSNSQEPSHHNYPGSLIGVSAGGQWTPGIDTIHYSHLNVHPPRGEKWDQGMNGDSIGATCKELRRRTAGRPLAFNESIHCMTQVEWDYWVVSGKMPKWGNLSTTDAQRHLAYMETILDNGVSFCAHDLLGQETDPSAELSYFEKEWKHMLNPGPTDPPPSPSPPPPPPPPEEIRMKHVATHVATSGTSYKLERLPEVVEGGSESYVLRETFVLPVAGIVKDISVFHGTDRGDIVEMDTEIYANPGGVPIFLRSDHKEALGQFDAWSHSGDVFPAYATSLIVNIVCRTNGPNYLTDELESRPHWGIWIIVA